MLHIMAQRWYPCVCVAVAACPRGALAHPLQEGGGEHAPYTYVRGAPSIRERPRGVDNSGGWKTYRKFGEKTLPKNVFGPPTYDTFFPPLFGDSLSFPLKERGTDQTNPNLWGLQKWFWKAHSAVRFPPPPNSRDTFCPALSRCPTVLLRILLHTLAVPWRGPLQKKEMAPPVLGVAQFWNYSGVGICFIFFWGSPTVQNLEIQNLLGERFRDVSGLVPDFILEMLNSTRGTSKYEKKAVYKKKAVVVSNDRI